MIAITRLRQVLGFPPEKDQELETVQQVLIYLFETRASRGLNRKVNDVEQHQFMHDCTHLYTHRRPLESVTSVEERAAGSSTWTLLNSSSYLVETGRASRIERLSGVWSQFVRVTCTTGYTWDTSIVGANVTPADIQRAMEIQAQFFVTRFGLEKLATKSQSFDGMTVALEEADLHPHFKATVDRYARRF